jgi:transcriptional regulator with XRE-family HTH domain
MSIERGINMKIATNQERLNELFDADPRSDTAIATELGVSKQTISAWRSGYRSPKKPMLIKITEVYNVSIEWLMGFDVEKNGSSSKDPVAIVVPDSELFNKVVRNMSYEDYVMVIDAFRRTEAKMKEKGLL